VEILYLSTNRLTTLKVVASSAKNITFDLKNLFYARELYHIPAVGSRKSGR